MRARAASSPRLLAADEPEVEHRVDAVADRREPPRRRPVASTAGRSSRRAGPPRRALVSRSSQAPVRAPRPAGAARRRSAGCSRPRSRAPGARRTAACGSTPISSARSTRSRSRRDLRQLGVERGVPAARRTEAERAAAAAPARREVVVHERLRDARLLGHGAMRSPWAPSRTTTRQAASRISSTRSLGAGDGGAHGASS